MADLDEFDGPANDAHRGAEDEKAISMSNSTGKVGADKEGNKCHYIHGNRVDLSLGVCIPKSFEDGWLERHYGRSSIVCTKVCQCSGKIVSDS
jgi:hypothetical protein